MGAEHIASHRPPQADSRRFLGGRSPPALFPAAATRTRQDPVFKLFICRSVQPEAWPPSHAGGFEMSEFKLPIEQLDETAKAFHFVATREWWQSRERAAEGDRGDAEGPFELDLEARRVGERILLEGRLAGRLSLECSRCAKRYCHALRDEFRLVLEPEEGREPADPEGARGLAESGVCLGEDLESGWFRGPLIRLDDFFGEVIATNKTSGSVRLMEFTIASSSSSEK